MFSFSSEKFTWKWRNLGFFSSILWCNSIQLHFFTCTCITICIYRKSPKWDGNINFGCTLKHLMIFKKKKWLIISLHFCKCIQIKSVSMQFNLAFLLTLITCITKMQCRIFFKDVYQIYTHIHESMKAYNVVDNKVLRVEITVSF